MTFRLICSLVPFVAALTLMAQAPSQDRTVIRVTTRLVEVNVVVRENDSWFLDGKGGQTGRFVVLDRARVWQPQLTSEW